MQPAGTLLVSARTEMMEELMENDVGVTGSMIVEWRGARGKMVIRAASGHTKRTELMMEPLEKCCPASKWNTEAMCGRLNWTVGRVVRWCLRVW